MVELVHAPGVDQLPGDPQVRDERARHARPALVEELLQGVVGADHGDQARALGVGDQQRDVLAGPGSGQRDGVQAELTDPGQPGCAAVRVGVHDQLGPAAQRLVGDRVHVAEDDVGLVAGLEQRVRAAVHRDHHRLVLADVGPEGGEVLAVVVAADHDQDMPPAMSVSISGAGMPVGEQGVLAPEELQRVRRERFDLHARPWPAASVMAASTDSWVSGVPLATT